MPVWDYYLVERLHHTRFIPERRLICSFAQYPTEHCLRVAEESAYPYIGSYCSKDRLHTHPNLPSFDGGAVWFELECRGVE